jgi:hypothetical protein
MGARRAHAIAHVPSVSLDVAHERALRRPVHEGARPRVHAGLSVLGLKGCRKHDGAGADHKPGEAHR